MFRCTFRQFFNSEGEEHSSRIGIQWSKSKHSFPNFFTGSMTNIDDDAVKCNDGSIPEMRNKVISGVVGAASSVTSIQVANLLRLFKIPQVR